MEKINYKETVKNLRETLKNYLVEHNIKSMTLGISGGIDSALVCALAYPVAKELGIELIGRSISIQTNKPDEQERARNIGKHFCTNFDEIDLTDEYLEMEYCTNRVHTDNLLPSNETERERKIRLGNVKARMRMIYIYDLAQKNKGFVLSTDNYTELLVGFWTINGDVGDYGMIQELWKTEVYEMTEWIAKNECSNEASEALIAMLDAVATDGLGITSSDLDQLLPDWKDRYTTTRQGYKEVDEILEEYLVIKEEIVKLPKTYDGYIEYKERRKVLENHPIIKRHNHTHFKRNHPLNLKRKDFVIFE
jgi:NAD+ synthetase